MTLESKFSLTRRGLKSAAALTTIIAFSAFIQPEVTLVPKASASSSTAPGSAGSMAPTDPARGVASYGPQLQQAMGAVVQVMVETPSAGGMEPRRQRSPMADSAAERPEGSDSRQTIGRPSEGNAGRRQGPNINVEDPETGPGGSKPGQQVQPGPPRQRPDGRSEGQPGYNGSGSGVIYDSSRGLILTNHHVVAGATRIAVKLGDGRDVEATLVGSDAATDIAVLRIPSQSLPVAVKTASSQTVQVGDLAFAIGYPMGLERTLTMGIVSGLNRSGIGEGIEDFIQTDASINRGNSGGPLVDSQGRLIGINTAIFSPTGGNIGIGFAVPTQIALSVAKQLEQNGRVDRGRIGVSIGPVTPQALSQAQLETPQGALIGDVEPGSPAAQAGIRVGDVVVSAGQRQIVNPRMLHAAVATTPQGERLALVVVRAGRRLDMSVQVLGSGSRQILASAQRPAR